MPPPLSNRLSQVFIFLRSGRGAVATHVAARRCFLEPRRPESPPALKGLVAAALVFGFPGAALEALRGAVGFVQVFSVRIHAE
jgi:hypothetical protein